MNLVFLVITRLLLIYSLRDLVHLVIVRPTLYPRSTFNVNLESVSITIMSKGAKLQSNTVLELYFGNSRNTCDLGPLDVPFARKRTHFTCGLETSSYGTKISNFGYQTKMCLKVFGLNLDYVQVIC